MTISIPLSPQAELAAEVAVDLSRVRYPQYGRYLDELEPGQVFEHPRGFTFTRSNMLEFARTFMQANPLYLNAQYACACGFADLPASPQMVFNVILSLGVQNDSEKAIANLGYYQVQFLRAVYPGDTLRSFTKVLERKDRGPDKPGITRIRTVGVNQDNAVVLQYERKIMVGWRGERRPTTPAPQVTVAFPGDDTPTLHLPLVATSPAAGLTGPNTYLEDFTAGDIIVHANGRTITEEHMALTYSVGNSHPLHFDRLFSSSLSGKMSGEPIVYGGLVFAWLEGLASRDVSEHAVWELGFTEGYHTQPAFAGDTVGALTRILAVENVPGNVPGTLPSDELVTAGYGVVTMQLIGVKNISAATALEKYGADLFIKEDDKRALGKEKITDKIFEIERRLLIKRRPR